MSRSAPGPGGQVGGGGGGPGGQVGGGDGGPGPGPGGQVGSLPQGDLPWQESETQTPVISWAVSSSTQEKT